MIGSGWREWQVLNQEFVKEHDAMRILAFELRYSNCVGLGTKSTGLFESRVASIVNRKQENMADPSH